MSTSTAADHIASLDYREINTIKAGIYYAVCLMEKLQTRISLIECNETSEKHITGNTTFFSFN